MKSRVYIGLSITPHDPSIAIVNENGKVIFAEATERYMQNKRSWNCVPDDIVFIEKILEKYCPDYSEYVLAYTWSKSFLKILEHYKNIIISFLDKSFFKRRKCSMTSTLVISLANNGNFVGENLRFRLENMNYNAKIYKRYYDHHLTHAATACYGSSFKDAAVAIVDGLGERTNTNFYKYSDNKIKRIKSIRRSHASLGEFYSILCWSCGFDMIKGEEWKVMGLAAYGKFNEEYYNNFKGIIKVDGCTLKHGDSYGESMQKLYSYRRAPDAPSIESADLAFTGQMFYSDIMIELLNNLHEIVQSDNLVIGGGCGLNSAFNGKVVEKTPFKNVYVSYAPGDDGNSIGAALIAYYQDHPEKSAPAQIQSPYLGHKAKIETIQKVLEFGKLKDQLKENEDICKKTAELIANGKIVGWFQGAAEMGPRALGNRSILADPRNLNIKEEINARVKFREEYRPFAPSILHEFGNDYFENYQETPYMERALQFRKEVQDKVPGVVHVDGSGRLQSVKKEWNEKYYNLIQEFYKITGVPIILNTSFNVMGKPIVHSVEDAIAVFYTSGLDALIIENHLFIKE